MDFIREPLEFLKYASEFMAQDGVMCLTMPEHLPPSEQQDLSSFSLAEMHKLFADASLWVERHGQCVGYRDSETGVVRWYHLWMLRHCAQ